MGTPRVSGRRRRSRRVVLRPKPEKTRALRLTPEFLYRDPRSMAPVKFSENIEVFPPALLPSGAEWIEVVGKPIL